MSVSRDKAIDLANKLLRTAAPLSGATEAERTNAALHAAELVAQHDLVLAVADKHQHRRKREAHEPQRRETKVHWPHAPAGPRYSYSSHDWREFTLQVAVGCANCGKTMMPGDAVFVQPSTGLFIHAALGCDQRA